jgi:hypothetical protein
MKPERHTETRRVPVPLSPGELTAVAKKLSQSLADLSVARERIKAATCLGRERAKEIEKEIARLADIHRTGREMREIQVLVTVSAGVAHLIDPDTGEELATEPAEKQPALPFDAKSAAAGDGPQPDSDPPPAARPKNVAEVRSLAGQGVKGASSEDALITAPSDAARRSREPATELSEDEHAARMNHPELCCRAGCEKPSRKGSHFCADHRVREKVVDGETDLWHPNGDALLVCAEPGCEDLASRFGRCDRHQPAEKKKRGRPKKSAPAPAAPPPPTARTPEEISTAILAGTPICARCDCNQTPAPGSLFCAAHEPAKRSEDDIGFEGVQGEATAELPTERDS